MSGDLVQPWAALDRTGIRNVRAVVLAGQLTVVPDRSACLADLPSAQLTSVVSIRISGTTKVVTKVLPVCYLRLAPLGLS